MTQRNQEIGRQSFERLTSDQTFYGQHKLKESIEIFVIYNRPRTINANLVQFSLVI